ncbi:MAG TPA: PilN domain-containing protein [Alphaproteobacteria bacterium]|nr:PilN domain-containing protein [Alphaproteobacteria bacterium]
MIRINLLGIPKARRGKRAAAVSVPGEGPSNLTLGLICVIVLAVLAGGSYVWVNNQHSALEKDMQAALQENQRLASVKDKYEASKRRADLFDRRVKVIDQLKQQQTGPLDLLNLVAETVNKTDAVWLETMTRGGPDNATEKNPNITLFTGIALSANNVADLSTNLKKTGVCKTVEIREAAQDTSIKEVQAFKFDMTCERAVDSK